MSQLKEKAIISHIRTLNNGEKIIQSNAEHSIGVATLTEQFASEFGMADWGHFLGIIHDKGKERDDFQNYIRDVNGMGHQSYRDKTHAWIGAKLVKEIAPNLYPLTSFPILGHHAGLCDYTQIDGAINKEIPSGVDGNIKITAPSLSFFYTHNLFVKERQKYIHHVERMLFSCLVDADFLDTEHFMQPKKTEARQNNHTLSELLPKLESFLSQFKTDTPVNIIRKDIQDCCRETANKPQGIYSLTVPTGGGKTLSSLLWAMLHAIKNGKRRIIIAIPYTSIISQTAATLKNIFGEDAILEHHSNYDYNDDEYKNADYNPERLATENWDAPIIVTTNVQLFESMYASHPGKCRKLHNIVNSVIILDEVQTLPGEHLQAIVDALKAYNDLFGVSLLFTTASQPTFEGERKGHEKNLQGFDKIEELIPSNRNLHDKLRRVNLIFDENRITYDELVDRIMQFDRILCIVNTRRIAAELFKKLPQSVYHYHLSRNLCAEHVDSTLKTIKNRLKTDDGSPIRVITTQLIEAGVDIDFPVVMRQEIGLDSILQAAGRCNREGKMPEKGTTYVFKIDGEIIPPGNMTYANNARLNMNPQKDLFSSEAMNEYFTQYYNMIPTFDRKNNDGENIEYLLHKVSELQFDSANDYFQLIDNNSRSVVVKYGVAENLIIQMKNGNTNKEIYRKLGRFSVNVPKYIFDELQKKCLVESVTINGKDTGLYYVSDPKQYDSQYGLSINNHIKNETLIF